MIQKKLIAAAAQAMATNINCVRTPINPNVKMMPLKATMRVVPVVSRTQIQPAKIAVSKPTRAAINRCECSSKIPAFPSH